MIPERIINSIEKAVVNLDQVQGSPFGTRFDVIFLRNVLIYFSAESKARVIDRLLSHLAPSGYLFLGHAETLNGVTDQVRSVMPTVYMRLGKPNPTVQGDGKVLR